MSANVIGPSRESVTDTSPSSDLRFCRDCKWLAPYDNKDLPELGKCLHPSAKLYWAKALDSDGLVTGELRFSFARNERARADGCGFEATLFEPKPATSATVTASETPNKSTDSAYIAALILILVAFASAIVTALCIKGLE